MAPVTIIMTACKQQLGCQCEMLMELFSFLSRSLWAAEVVVTVMHTMHCAGGADMHTSNNIAS